MSTLFSLVFVDGLGSEALLAYASLKTVPEDRVIWRNAEGATSWIKAP